MSDEEPSMKRRKSVYGSDGMKLVSQLTVRRRRKAVADARAAELMRYALEDDELRTLHIGDNARPEQLDYDTEPSGSRTNPIARNEGDEVHSSDSDTLAIRTEHASSQAIECEQVAQLCSPNDSCVTITTINDDVLDNSAATTVSSDGSNSEDDGGRSSAFDESPRREASSPGTTDSASSPIVLDFDRENATTENLREYVHSGAGDAVMFPEANIKTWQVIMIILGLCTRFSLNGKARRALIDAVKLFAGPRFSEWNISDYYLSKIFDPPDEATLYYFYCEECYERLEQPVTKRNFKNHVAVCDKCSKSYSLNLMDPPNYFVSIDLEYQLTSLLHLKVVNEDLAKNLDNSDTNGRSGDYICDVHDGSLYKKLVSETPPDSRLLTCVFNTDGAPVFNSSKRAFWPILIILNELSPSVRFRYPLLAGMCIVRKEPSPDLMNTYLKPFVRALQRLGTVGFDAQVGGKTVHFILKALFCSVDSVARPLLQNRLQFNGYHGCSWCYSKGQHMNGCMRFLMEEPDPINRTHSDYIADAREAAKKNRHKRGTKKKSDVRGTKGCSVLMLLDSFDMVWGFSRDYLHADCFGDILQLVNMWCDAKCPVRLTKTQMAKVNERLMQMTPPQEVHRLVRPLKTERCKWKASEWRSFLLFYAIPCLTGILDDYALQHLALYVNSIYMLLKTNISKTELQKARYDLERYVIIFEVLYGAQYVTFNVHTVKHIVDSVITCGPLWATSAFPFESTIYQLKQCVHGARNICEQMSKKSIQRNVYRSLLEEADESPACLAFQKSLFGRTEVASYNRTGSTVFFGAGVRYTGTARELRDIAEDEITAFRRCISSGMVIHSAAYDKVTLKTDDTVFRTDGEKYVQVLHLLKYRETALAEVVYFEVEKVIVPNVHGCRGHPEIPDVTIEHLVRVVKDDGTKVIRVTRLREKCVVMKVDGETYLSRLPNTIEVQ